VGRLLLLLHRWRTGVGLCFAFSSCSCFFVAVLCLVRGVLVDQADTGEQWAAAAGCTR